MCRYKVKFTYINEHSGQIVHCSYSLQTAIMKHPRLTYVSRYLSTAGVGTWWWYTSYMWTRPVQKVHCFWESEFTEYLFPSSFNVRHYVRVVYFTIFLFSCYSQVHNFTSPPNEDCIFSIISMDFHFRHFYKTESQILARLRIGEIANSWKLSKIKS